MQTPRDIWPDGFHCRNRMASLVCACIKSPTVVLDRRTATINPPDRAHPASHLLAGYSTRKPRILRVTGAPHRRVLRVPASRYNAARGPYPLGEGEAVKRLAVACCSLLLTLGAAASHATGAVPALQPPAPVVVAVMEPGGFNVLHQEFRTANGRDPVLPAGMPAMTGVDLPNSGDFAERLAAAQKGPLGSLAPGRLYRIAGTRIIGVMAGGDNLQPVDVFANPGHGTGVAGALGGLVHGTDPNVLLVLVTSVDRAAWEWVAQQPWIDFVEASYLSVNGSGTIGVGRTPTLQQLTCEEGPSVATLISRGRLVFSAQGNTEQVGALEPPSGLPGVIHVGGVDSRGATWLPGDASPDQNITASTPTRPYDVGELYSFPSLAPDSLTATAWFGGTSGATPRLVGDAARLVEFSRHLLGTTSRASTGVALASAGPHARRPNVGPLHDGTLTSSELESVLFSTAQPASPVPNAFMVEGYGGYGQAAITVAEQVLTGSKPEPDRSVDDEQKTAVDTERAAVFNSYRCAG